MKNKKRGETGLPSLFEKETWVALRKLFKKERERFGYTCLGPKCIWEAGGRKQWFSTGGNRLGVGECYLGVGVCLATLGRYLVQRLRERLGRLNVS